MSVSTNSTSIRIGTRLPEFALKNVDGRMLSSAVLAEGRILGVIFSCNHCPYVQGWEERMKQIQTEYAPEGLQLVCINSNDDVNYPEDSFDEMVKRHRAKGFNFPFLRDDTQKVAKSFGATHTPEVFVFGRDGLLAYHGRIDDNYKDPGAVKSHDLRDALDSVVAGKAPKTPETYSIGCTIKWK